MSRKKFGLYLQDQRGLTVVVYNIEVKNEKSKVKNCGRKRLKALIFLPQISWNIN
jgi:hypothetical protein